MYKSLTHRGLGCTFRARAPMWIGNDSGDLFWSYWGPGTWRRAAFWCGARVGEERAIFALDEVQASQDAICSVEFNSICCYSGRAKAHTGGEGRRARPLLRFKTTNCFVTESILPFFFLFIYFIPFWIFSPSVYSSFIEFSSYLCLFSLCLSYSLSSLFSWTHSLLILFPFLILIFCVLISL